MSNNKTASVLTGISGVVLGAATAVAWSKRDKIKNQQLFNKEQVDTLKTKAEDVVQFVQAGIGRLKASKFISTDPSVVEIEISLDVAEAATLNQSNVETIQKEQIKEKEQLTK